MVSGVHHKGQSCLEFCCYPPMEKLKSKIQKSHQNIRAALQKHCKTQKSTKCLRRKIPFIYCRAPREAPLFFLHCRVFHSTEREKQPRQAVLLSVWESTTGLPDTWRPPSSSSRLTWQCRFAESIRAAGGNVAFIYLILIFAFNTTLTRSIRVFISLVS